MSRGIFLIGSDGDLVEMREQPYDSESLLQGFLESHPALLPGDQIDPEQPRRWLLIAREISVPGEEGGSARWYLDHLFLDQDAVPTLVEVKRSSDIRIRREVVGQMLDYAANAVGYWPIEHLQLGFQSTCRARGVDPDLELRMWLGEGREPEAFWQEVKTNLKAGRIRLLFVADVIPPELRAIVEFLNSQMDPAEILAVEIRQFTSGAMRTLVPNVFGQTVEAQQRKGMTAQSPQWNETSFFEELERRTSAQDVAAMRDLFEWATLNSTRVFWGKGPRVPSFIPILRHQETDHQLFGVYVYESHVTIEIQFQYYKSKPPFDSEQKRMELRARLNAIPTVSIPDAAIGKRPSISLGSLLDETSRRHFIEAFDWMVSEVRKA